MIAPANEGSKRGKDEPGSMAKLLVGRSITRINMRGRKATGIEVRVTGRWEVTGSAESGALTLGPSKVAELIPGNGGEIVTATLHVQSVSDRISIFNASRTRMTCDGIALLVDANEDREREVMEEMLSKGMEYVPVSAPSAGHWGREKS